MAGEHSIAHSTAVLVHGGWGNPTDWRFVERLLVDRGVTVVAPDLPSHPPDLSHILFPDEKTCVLDDGWWLTDGDATTLPTDVLAHLHEHRRRPMALEAVLAPQVAEAWRTVPTTVLLGRTDDVVGPELRSWATSYLDDVRLVDSDHFILWRKPDVIADVVLEPLATG